MVGTKSTAVLSGWSHMGGFCLGVDTAQGRSLLSARLPRLFKKTKLLVVPFRSKMAKEHQTRLIKIAFLSDRNVPPFKDPRGISVVF